MTLRTSEIGTDAQRSGSTTADLPSPSRSDRRAVWARRVFLSVLALIVVAGAAGFLGVKARTVLAYSARDRTTLRVHYAQVGRAGLDVPFEITVHRPGGFRGRGVVLAVSSSYLEIFDRGSVDPQPASETTDAARAMWTFDAPPRDTLVVTVDLQVQSGRHIGRSGTVALLGDNGKPIVSSSFTTWLAP
jgi:hypothetical protein